MSTNITSDFFKDVIIYKLFPHLIPQTISILRRVSKAIFTIVDDVASKPHLDQTLSKREVTKNFKDKVPSYLRYRAKTDTLNHHPELWQTLDKSSKVIANPEDLQSWIDYTNAHNDTHLPPVAVIFDFDKPLLDAQGNCSLGDALNREAWEHPPNVSLIKAILSIHPNSGNIKADGMFGLGRALISAIFKAKNIEIVKAIFKHVNAVSIPATGMFSLAGAISNAIDIKNKAIVVEILKQPNAKKIPAEGGYMKLIEKAKKEGANEIHDLLMQFFCPITQKATITPKEN